MADDGDRVITAEARVAHAAAVARGDDGYADPDTGWFVFTAPALLARGRCCGNRCRHCPFGHAAVQSR